MHQEPLVSILMNCYNSDEFLKEAIASVISQSYKNWQILFIDNQSTDKSAEIVQSFQDKRICYYKTPHFMSLYEARAFGQQFVTGKYLGFLDCDDAWFQDKLSIQVQQMEKNNIFFLHGAFKVRYEGMGRIKSLVRISYQILKQILFFSKVTNVEQQLKHYEINLQTVLVRADRIREISFRPEYNLFGDLVFFVEFAKKNAVSFFRTSHFLAMTRIHPKQLSKQSAENWVKEASVCEKKVFFDILNQKEKKSFKVLKLFYKSEQLLFENKTSKSLWLKKKIKCFHPAYFLNYLKILSLKR